MKLRDLNPKLTPGVLVFDCPCGTPDKCDGGRVRVRVGPQRIEAENIWAVSGDFPELTLRPSIRADGTHPVHVLITKGEVAQAGP